MKPIKLEMNYFGPFESEKISFDSVKNSLFLISGKTGSGKTMIFDAITYALYGTLSTNGRQEASVRSQFAAEADESRVKLVFEIKGNQYTVERVLPYYKAGRKSQVPPKAVLYGEDGGVLDSSLNGVKEKVQEIVQLTSDQFRQILILPQGEFKKLLTSTSESKQEILRTLFRTQRFVNFEMKLNELKKERQKEIEIVENKIEELFNTISIGGDESLEPLLNDDYPTFQKRLSAIGRIQDVLGETKQKLVSKTTVLKNESKSLNETIQSKERHNQQVEKLNETERKLKSHLDQKDSIDNLERQINEYKLIKTIEYELRTEQNALEQKETLAAKTRELEDKLKGHDKAGESLKKTLDSIHEFHDTYENYRKWVNATERFVKDERFQHMYSELKADESELERIKNQNAVDESELDDIKESLQQIDWSRENADKSKEEKYRIEAELTHIDQKIKEEEKHAADEQEKQRLEEEVNSITDKIEHIEASVDNKKNELGSKYKNEDRAHIEHLISHLEIGGACPVCQQQITVLPRAHEYLSEAEEAEFVSLQNKKEQLAEKREETKRNISVISRILESAERQDLKALDENLYAAKEHLVNVNNQIQEQNQAYKKKQELEELQRETESRLNQNKLNQNNLENRIAQVSSMIKDFEKETGFDDFETFIDIFNQRQEEVEKHEKMKEEKEQEQKAHNEKKSRLEENLKSGRESLKTIEDQIIQLTPVIDRFIDEHHLTDRNHLLTVLKETDISESERTVNEYYTQKEVLNSRIKDISESIESTTPVSVDEEKEKLSQIDADIESFSNESATLAAHIGNNRRIEEKIEGFTSKHEADLDKINELVELVDVVSGRNDQKISLERFVLTYYLDKILYTANIRLLEMTNHRYELRRSTAKSNRKTGLDIEVFDFYNNKPRHISSLSGGESFQASLTLALALNETLQQESGGISLDTMLVDEGFGTLDPETLDTAISTLIDLQTGGKMVGIISHVEELKERLDNILTVKAVNERSTAAFEG